MPRASNLVMSPAKVLVVDDESSLLETTAVILQANGFEPITASTVPDALVHVREEPLHALLADLSMPGDGRSVIAAMRARHPSALIVVITGHILPEAISPEVHTLADAILFKPVDIPRLLELLHAHRPPAA
ncbi:MAG: response regulator [Terriglobales bacterium]